MKYFIRLTLALCLLLGATQVRASHIYGADFFYEYLFGNTYKVSLVVYYDCSGNAFSNTFGSTPRVLVRKNGMSAGTIFLQQEGDEEEVTPVCTAEKANTACQNVTNPLPGVMRIKYSGTYTLNGLSSNWVFRFEGDMGSGGVAQAGRSNSITNIIIGGAGSLITLEALLNNINGNNSSPKFSTIPTPFYCINVAQQYNQGAIDINNDSLDYSLAPGLQGTGTVNYVSGYSATNPLSAAAGSFSFNNLTGQLNFTPSSVQRSLVVNEVKEYRNGVLVGSSSREMTFVVLGSCNVKPASSQIDTAIVNTKGGLSAATTRFHVCQGTDTAAFAIIAQNPANDTIKVSVSGLPNGAIATITGDSTTQPIISIKWPTATVAPGNYNFFVTYKDNGCPLTSTQTMAYTIAVIRPNTLSNSIVAPTQCIHKAYVKYTLANGLLPRTVLVRKAGILIDSFVDNTGVAYDSLDIGTYDIEVRSDKLLCRSYFQYTVVDGGTYPFKPKVVSPVFYCKNDIALPLKGTADSGAVLFWYDPRGFKYTVPPIPYTDTAGIFIYQANQRFKVCESLKDTILVYVTKRPTAAFTGPDSLCLKDTATFIFSGSVGVGPILEYKWDFGGAGYVTGEGADNRKVHWYGAGEKVVTLTVEENKCPSFPASKDVYVRPNPFAGFFVPDKICQFDTLIATYNSKPLEGQSYLWTFADDLTETNTTAGPIKIAYTTPGLKHFSLTTSLAGCSDYRDTSITVYPVPTAEIENKSSTACIGDKIYLIGSGGDNLNWSPEKNIFSDDKGAIYTLALAPTTYKLSVIDAHGCQDSAYYRIDKVEPCCNFSYPNAFTPNNDGHNDRFKVVTYGNQVSFELNIYNKWGQRVYVSNNAQQGWDGTFGGKHCDAGTYFYYVKAKCYTGQEEMHKGDVILIR
ncbi:MAG: gliding motility-associated C-terminal domain-containing protein [Bacteroidetes bacterium]|nr:gliding motility-associated C-terminal domain-containing protein [Bacteroidota bacterium]